MELADFVKSLRLHWRVSVAIVLLTGMGFAMFLVTRNQVAPAHRYRVTVDILVPAIDSKTGTRPAKVPPALLQGQGRPALSQSTEIVALNGARIPTQRRGGITFGFATNTPGDILTLSVTARDPQVAGAVIRSFAPAYISTRRAKVAADLKDGAAKAQNGLARLTVRLKAVKAALRTADPALLKTLPNSPTPASQNPVTQLSVHTPISTILLVVEHEQLLTQMLDVENAYALDTTQALIPQDYATIIEYGGATQITPPLPSPTKPAAAFLGIGLALALAAPVLMERLDKSIRTPKTAALSFDSIVLTSIPTASRRHQRELVTPGTPQDGAYRALAATSIATDRLPEAIVVTSPTGIVQDTVAANFAAALAGLGLRVALVATDARQSWFLDTSEPTESGLPFPELLELAHGGRLDGALTRGLVKTHLDKLLVLPPGGEDREIRLDGLRPLLEGLSTSGVDVTVIAGPAVLDDPNATILAWTTRSVLWAFETGEVTEAEAKEAASRIELAGATSFGIAMVNGKT